MNQSSTSPAAGSRLRRVATLPLLAIVEAYRRLISPLLGPRCRYYPTCSGYAVDALKAYGPVRGSILAAWRVMRCNPLSDGGFDYVEDQKLFRRRPAASHVCEEHHNHRGVTT